MPDGSDNAFMFQQAVRENTPMVMALAGASGSGKTFTALELAMGLAGDGKVAVIDTEGRRALHYADLRDPRSGQVLFRFDHGELRPPFSPERFLDAMKAAERAGYRVIVLDSFSDEHEGEGGLIDMAAAGRSENTAANWARPKAQHKLIVRWLRQARCHVIFCLRAEERVRLEKVWDERKQREVTAVVPIGWVPICEKRFMYDMTASFLLSPDRPGIPEPIKLQEQHRRFFPAGQRVTRDSGRELAAWAAGGATVPRAEPTVEDRAREAAERGKAALSEFWKGLGRDQRRLIAHLIAVGDEPGELARRAAAVDAGRIGDDPPDEIPFDDAGRRSALSEPAPDEDAFGLPPLPERGDAQHEPPAGAARNAESRPDAPAPAGDDLFPGDPPAESLYVPLPRDPKPADWDFWLRQVEALIDEGKNRAGIKLANEYAIKQLKEVEFDRYSELQRKLAMRPETGGA